MKALVIILVLIALALVGGHRNASGQSGSSSTSVVIPPNIPSTPDAYVSVFPFEMGNRMLVLSCESAVQYGSELDIDFWC